MSNEVKRMSAREGRIFVDGSPVTNAVKFKAVFTPEISKKAVLGQKGKTSKILGFEITGSITQFKATTMIKNLIKHYQSTGEWPSMEIQAVADDVDSDFYKNYGESRIQLLGVQFEGDLPLMDLDREGEEIQEEIEFSASQVKFLD